MSPAVWPIIVAVICVALWFIPLEASFGLAYGYHPNRFWVKVRVLRITLLTIGIPVDRFFRRVRKGARDAAVVKGEEKRRAAFLDRLLGKQWWQRLYKKAASSLNESFNAAARSFLRRAVFSRITVKALIGTGDAAQTAWLIGALWFLVGLAFIPVHGWVKVAPGAPHVSIEPDFQQEQLRLEAECIVRFKNGDFIIAVAVFGWNWLKRGVKGIGRSSNSGFNENRYGKYQGNG